jgi:hypothetical protein
VSSFRFEEINKERKKERKKGRKGEMEKER